MITSRSASARTVTILAGVMLATGMRDAALAQSRVDILGEWRGTSLCTDLKLAPACHDEQVRYTFRPLGTAPDSTHLIADKMVDGKYELMGEIDLGLNKPTGEWTMEFRSPRGQVGRWTYAVRGDSLSGSLVDVPTGGRVRVVSARRR